MNLEVQQLIDLITKMQDRQEAAQTLTNEHLSKLRDSMHEIKNEYHGVSQVTMMIKKEMEDLKDLHDKEITAVTARVSHNEKVTTEQFKTLNAEVVAIAENANSFGRIRENVSKAVTVVIVGLCFSAIAFFYNKGS